MTDPLGRGRPGVKRTKAQRKKMSDAQRRRRGRELRAKLGLDSNSPLWTKDGQTFCLYCQEDYETAPKLAEHILFRHSETYAAYNVLEERW